LHLQSTFPSNNDSGKEQIEVFILN